MIGFGFTFFYLVVEDCGLGNGIDDRGLSHPSRNRLRIAVWREKNAIASYRNRNCDRNLRFGSSRNRAIGHDRALWQSRTLESSLVGACSSRTRVSLGLECGTDSERTLGAIASRRREFFTMSWLDLGLDHGLGSGAEISLTGAVDQRSRSTIV